jgi:single-strand DNA-binding protein
MASYNKVLLMGNLTRDPEVRYTPKGTAVCTMGLAVNETYTTASGEQKEEVVFVDVEVFGRTAENVGQYLSKGRPVFVDGHLRLDSWDDKETGKKRQKLKVVAFRVQFLGSPKGASGGGEISDAPPAAKPARPRQAPAPATEEAPSGEGEDNIPF